MFTKIGNSIKNFNLVQKYRLASFLIMVVGMVGIGLWTVGEIEQGVIHGTAMTTALYIESEIEPKLADLDNSPALSEKSIADLDSLLKDTTLGSQIVVLKVWSVDGRVLYSNLHNSIGQTFPIEERLQKSLDGTPNTRISTLDSDENVAERSFIRLIETYSPLHQAGTNQVKGAVEFYQKTDDLEGLISTAQIGSWAVVAGGMIIIYLLLGFLVEKAGDTIENQKAALVRQVDQLTQLLHQNEELNERIRSAARSSATLNEQIYRRIGAEIHDGPAQELGLALLKIDTILARSEASHLAYHNNQPIPESSNSANEMLEDIQVNLQQAMQELRALASGLSLPELTRLSLEETILRPVRTHERKTRTAVRLEFGPLPEQAPLSVKIAAYRLVQEGLTNAFRHAGGIGQAVRAASVDNNLMIEISDKGPGFNVEEWTDSENHLGLAGMRERVLALGGLFNIESEAGQGTHILVSLSLQEEGIL